MLEVEFLKQFNIYNKYLQSQIDNIEDNLNKNIATNQLFVMRCISYGLVAQPSLFKYLMNPNLCSINKIENIEFYSKDIVNDKNQCLAVKKILGAKNVVAIQGPPGAGKTTVIVESIRQINSLYPNAKILLTSATHVAVDNVMERLLDTNLNLLRLKPKDENSSKPISKLYIDYYLSKIVKENPIIKDYIDVLKTEYINESLYNKDVVGITINALKSCRLNHNNYFDYTIIDEVCKITLPELLFAAKYSKKLILIGDPKQLPPSLNDYFESSLYTKEEYDYINLNPYINLLFETINKNAKLFLNKQYRMVREIGNYISDAFYNGVNKLENGRRDSNKYALNFINYNSKDCRCPISKGKLQNPTEVEIIKQLLNTKLKNISKSDIAIISPYKDQVNLLRRELNGFLIDTVDSFQGQAAKIVIYTCVRNFGEPTTFFKKENRINVAISRAKNQVWMIGNRNYVEKVSFLKLYLNYNKKDDDIICRTYIHEYVEGKIKFNY